MNGWTMRGRRHWTITLYCHHQDCDQFGEPQEVRGYTETDTGAGVVEREECWSCDRPLDQDPPRND